VASSADGTTLLAAAGSGLTASATGPVYTSTNSGLTWTQASVPQAAWVGTAASADGTRLAAVIYNGPLYTSADSGVTWTQSTAPSTNWFSVASSADGSKLISAAGGYTASGQIYSWQGASSPILSIAPSGAHALISWTVPSAPFALQEFSDFSSTNWNDLRGAVELNLTNLQNQLVVPFSGSNAFYRLRSL
jgi:hypothetical protein